MRDRVARGPNVSAPIPCGPPILWAETLRVSAPRARLSTGTLPAAWMASTCSQPSAARTICAASATGWITPVSLLASISATNGLPSAVLSCQGTILSGTIWGFHGPMPSA